MGKVLTDVSCAAFRQLPPAALQPGTIHRFVIGEDREVRVFAADAAAQELGDPFATLLLLRGIFPRSAGEVLEALDRVLPDQDPLRTGFFFLVGEGSQLMAGREHTAIAERFRFLVTRGAGTSGADILISTAHPDRGDLELMAWDARSGGFNYYQTVGDASAWVFAGNSRHALRAPTQGFGPFESHLSGNVVMKELRRPWINWHSEAANILPSVLPQDPPLVGHPWVTGRHPQGAEIAEIAVVKPAITRWTRTRFEHLLGEDGIISDPHRIMVQILGTPSVNLISSHTESRAATLGVPVDLPQTFFIDSEALTEVLGLRAPPAFKVTSQVYTGSLSTFAMSLTDGLGFQRPGDTHFAFLVPERAFEDRQVLERAIEVGLISRRLAACLLMTDFPNPIFSSRRAALLAHVPTRAVVSDGASSFSEDMAEAIVNAPDASVTGSPEHEFSTRWALGDDFRDAFDELLEVYYRGIQTRLATSDGYHDYVRLAESRRDRVRAMPVAETPLLFARTNVPQLPRHMRADGTVAEG